MLLFYFVLFVAKWLVFSITVARAVNRNGEESMRWWKRRAYTPAVIGALVAMIAPVIVIEVFSASEPKPSWLWDLPGWLGITVLIDGMVISLLRNLYRTKRYRGKL